MENMDNMKMVVKDFKVVRMKINNILVKVNKLVYLGSEINSGWKMSKTK
jgi:hypothetical protein